METTTTTTTVAQVMTREIFAVRPETDLMTTAKLLSEHHITGAPVIDEDYAPIGVVTLADLVDPEREHSERIGESTYYFLSDRTDAELQGEGAHTPVGVVADVMSSRVLAVSSTMTLRQAAEKMLSEDVHRLLVVDRGRLVGLISTMDVLRGFIERDEL